MSENKITIKGKADIDNLVTGTQASGTSLDAAAALASASVTSGNKNEVVVEQGAELRAKTAVVGFQYIGNEATATADDLRNELRALREKLDAAISAGEIADTDDAEDVTKAVARAGDELDKSAPTGERVIKNLETTATILDRVAGAITKAGGIGSAVLALAPIAKALLAIGQRIFGG